MKLKDYVCKSIWQYPSLYKDVDYERSEMKVLAHVFMTGGNGLYLAETADPKQGGYYVYPKTKRVNGEWTRLQDKPYGVEKFRNLPSDYFIHPVYYISQAISGRSVKESAYTVKGSRGYQDSVFVRIHKEIEEREEFEPTITSLLDGPRLVEAESRYEFRPYPFSFDYSAYGDLSKGGFLQPDWMDGLVRLSRAALDYYLDPEKNKNEYSHPSFIVDDAIKEFQDATNEGPQAIVALKKKRWGWEKNPTPDAPSEAEIRQWAQDLFDDSISTRVAILRNFLNENSK